MDVRIRPLSAPVVSPHASPPPAARAVEGGPAPAPDCWAPSTAASPDPAFASGMRAARVTGIGLALALTLCGLPAVAHDLPVPAPPAVTTQAKAVDPGSLKPLPSRTYQARGTGYYPKHTRREGGPLDMLGKKLHTLQDYLAGKVKYVSVAMDTNAGLPYGTRLKIPELEAKYHREIEFRVVDTGDDFQGKGTSRIDICVRNHAASLDSTINGPLTLIPRD